jgi:hypothetical protein
MDKAIRNTLRGVVTKCRRILEEAVAEQLEGQFGIHASGKVEETDRLKHLSKEDREYREQILIHVEHIKAAGFKPTDAVAQLVREVSFTHLNRVCAYKMMEKRALIREAVSRGMKSQGFPFYLAKHPDDEKLSSGGKQDVAYRHYLESVAASFANEIGALFSPDDPANRLFPPQRVLEQVFELINGDDLKDIWTEDETIGWIYQYFTPKELRDQARKESSAPRNGYELAFRNQFFTPRYVVRFLTDNTLGRIWYEMRKGNTILKDKCQYLVRRPKEVFLNDGETAPKSKAESKELSQEELLKQPVYIPHRPKKDPRELRILDPACGSGHFLLYCFLLLLWIYEEAYDDPDLCPKLKQDYPDRNEFTKAVPGLILRHNLYGIDIDMRATQIAALALWLRAQKAYDEMGLKPDQRPKITRSNIVCAEPMPGEQELLDEFAAELQPKVLGQLVRVVFDKMKLAGEAGSLLKIEEELRDAIAAARKQWITGPKLEQMSLFPKQKQPKPEQMTMFDVSGITDEQFWIEAEARVIEALRDYAKRAANGKGLTRRLFAEDAERGFAFVDTCRQQFDVVLMNPPFGASSKPSKAYIDRAYPRTKNDLYAAFTERWLSRGTDSGYLAAITSRTGFFLSSFQKWREEIVLHEAPPIVVADLGAGVLDTAMVETVAYCLSRTDRHIPCRFFSVVRPSQDEKPIELRKAIGGQVSDAGVFDVLPLEFGAVHGSPFAYWVPRPIRKVFQTLSPLEPSKGIVRVGLQTDDDFRFVRCWWEIEPRMIAHTIEETERGKSWVHLLKGGEASAFYSDIRMVVYWANDGAEVKQWITKVLDGGHWSRHVFNTDCYCKPGLSWAVRTRSFMPSAVPAGCIFTVSRYLLLPNDGGLQLLGLLNGSLITYLLRISNERFEHPKFIVGTVQRMPIPDWSDLDGQQLQSLAAEAFSLKRDLDYFDETSHAFCVPPLVASNNQERSLAETEKAHNKWFDSRQRRLSEIQEQLDSLSWSAYGLEDCAAAGGGEDAMDFFTDPEEKSDDGDEEHDTATESRDASWRVGSLFQWVFGVVLGLWDVRTALTRQLLPKLPKPFSPLPSCSNARLVDVDGLPAKPGHIVSEEWLRARPDANSLPPVGKVKHPTIPDVEYPLRIDWDGILVDDPEHQDDIVRRVRDVLALLWRDSAEAIEKEACEILEVKELRDYFRKPGNGGFWMDHVKRYSKSRRKAPIYWLLQSSQKNYALWLYYHRLDKDMLFKALVKYIEPKLRREENRLQQIRSQATVAGTAGRSAKLFERELDAQQELLSELQDFHDKLKRAAELNLTPDLNDGVVLNIAPLWELVPWKEAQDYWEELVKGKYEWSTISKQIQEKRLVGGSQKPTRIEFAVFTLKFQKEKDTAFSEAEKQLCIEDGREALAKKLNDLFKRQNVAVEVRHIGDGEGSLFIDFCVTVVGIIAFIGGPANALHVLGELIETWGRGAQPDSTKGGAMAQRHCISFFTTATNRFAAADHQQTTTLFR